MNVNYKSDFALIIQFEDGIPTYPWRINFATLRDGCTTPSGSYTALFDGENYFRAHPLGESTTEIVVEFSNHSLRPGTLYGEWFASFESALFEGGEQLVVTPQITEVTLVEGAGDDAVDPEVWAIVSPILVADGGSSSTPSTSTSTSLTNAAVTIDESGIALNAAPTGANNVMGGLLGAFVIDTDGELERVWMPNQRDQACTVNVNYVSNWRILEITVSAEDDLGFGAEPDDLYCLFTNYQRNAVDYYEPASLRFHSKYMNFKITFIVGDDGNFPGAEIFVFSRKQFWETSEQA
ncbi:MAG: hypothetical protein R3Y68_04195 [Rikenellaceae bacterium]